MIFNLAALAAFFMLAINKKCRTAAMTLGFCVLAQVATSYDFINLVTPNIMLPIEFLKVVLIGYFFVSLTCQLVIVKILRFRTAQRAFVSYLSVIAVINDTLGLMSYWAWFELDGYNLRSQIIITLQALTIWIFRNGNLRLLHAGFICGLGDFRDSRHDKG